MYDDLERSVAFAQMVEKAGAQIIAVHGRTREQKRLAEYKCNWYVVFFFLLSLVSVDTFASTIYTHEYVLVMIISQYQDLF